jgi:L-aminopeptidase/D-esterase-like protein
LLNLLTDVAGVRVGHATDLALGSGVTAILFDTPAVAAACIAGGAPGTRDTEMLRPENAVERIDAVVFSGGSAFGLDAAGGAQAWLREAGRGTAFAGARVPLVASAILFDLTHGGDKDWGRFSPYRELGHVASAAAAAGRFALGTVGAGTGATTATCKGGIGSASAVTAHGHRVAALVAVNALGSVTVGASRHFWAAPFECAGEFGGLGLPATFAAADLAFRPPPRATPATTLGLVVTDAALSPPQAQRLAIMANDGLARAILPAHAPLDGDAMFAASTGRRGLENPLDELTELGHVAAIVVARAIARGVFEATALPQPGALRGWRLATMCCASASATAPAGSRPRSSRIAESASGGSSPGGSTRSPAGSHGTGDTVTASPASTGA